MGAAEPIVAVLPGLQQHKGFLGLKVNQYNLLITPQRLVFAAMSTQLMKEMVQAARDRAKADGANWVGQLGAQFAWMDLLVQRLETMTPDAILAEFAGSFAMGRDEVRRITTRTFGDDDSGRHTHEVRIEAASGKLKFTLASKTADEARQILVGALPGVVR